MEERVYQEGEIILRQGDPSDFVLRVMIGEVEVFTEKEGHQVVLGTVKNNDFLGEMGAIERRPRSASARAKTKVTAIIFERWEFLRLMSEEASAAYRIIVRLSERLRAVNEKLAEETVLHEEHAHGEKTVPGTMSLRLFSPSDSLRRYIPKEGLSITKFPFTVGHATEDTASPLTAGPDLSLPDTPPFRLSPVHFSLEDSPEGYVIKDGGSTLGTEVNGEFLGEPFGKDVTLLKRGENLIIAGGIHSPFVFKVFLEKV